MHDFTVVEFPKLGWSFNVPSIFADFTIPGINLHLTIRWYGVIIAFGFLLAVLFGGRMAYKWKMSLDKMVDVLIFGTFGGIIGARLYYVAFEWEQYQDHLADIFKIWEGGMAIYGGIIGGLLAAWAVCHFNKLNFRNLLDIGAMSLLLAQGIGRWGNYMNQEAFGCNTDLPWGMTSSKVVSYLTAHQADFAANGITVNPTQPVHPTFLYESIWCILGFFVLYLICRRFRKFSGQIILCYGVWYGLERMVVEGLRTDSLYIPGTSLRVSQLLSGALVVVCGVLLVYFLLRAKKNPQPIEGVDYYIDNGGKRIELVNGKPVPSDDSGEKEAAPASAAQAEVPAGENVPEKEEEKEADSNGDQN